MAGIVRPSKIIQTDKFAKIIITNRKGIEKCHSFIDNDDINKVKQHRWCCTNKNYVKSTINGKHIYLHRFLLDMNNAQPLIDHINQNPLDNRKENLRIADLSINRFNSKLNSNNTSGYRGIVYRLKGKRWEASFMVNGKKFYIIESKDKMKAVQKREEFIENLKNNKLKNGKSNSTSSRI